MQHKASMDNEHQPTHNVGESFNAAPASESKPVSTAPTSQPATTQDLAKTETAIEKRMSGFERSTLRWTRAMFFVTAATGLFISFQWLEMRSAGDQTERIIKADERLAAAMENSVNEAGKSLSATIAQNRLDQRAWLGFEDVNVTGGLGKPFHFAFKIKNSGKTPAYKVTLQYFIRNMERGQPLKFDYGGIPTIPSRGFIPPNGTAFVDRTNATPDEAEMTRIRTEAKRVYLYGRTAYSDVFGRPHWTTFCTYLTPEANGMSYCSDYNSSDDQPK